MDRASSLIYPGSKTLAGWWRQFAPRQPLALSIGYGFLHRIEAPVNVFAQQPIDPLAHHVLQALALEAGAVSPALLQERLRVPAPMVQRVLAGMRDDGLLATTDSGHWQTTERGQDALEHRSYPVRVLQRRVFPFIECLDPVGERLGPPQFVPLAECAGVSWPVDDLRRFDCAALQACLEQTPDWKQARAFPLDVETLAGGGAETWRHVIVDRPERVMLVLTLVNGPSGKEVLGYAVKVDGWTLYDQSAVLRMPAPATLWPELTQDLPMAVRQDAWRNWCKQRQLPSNEVEICALNYQPPRLEVQAPQRLLQRLQAAKSDLFKGEAWLLIGDGYMRTAVQLSVRGP